MNSRKTWLYGAIAFCLAVAIAVGIEIALRTGDASEPLALVSPDHGLIDPDGQPGMLLDDDLLWVHPGYAAELEAAGTERPDIVFLGDASTQNGSYPEKFRQRVEKAHAPHRLAVANLGIHASSTSQGRVLLERDALPLRPRSVAFYYGWTDHFLGLGDDEILRIGQARRSPLHQLRLVQFLGQRDLESLRAARSDTSRRVPKENFEENLRVMVRSARDNGTIPILLTAPTAFRPGRTPDALRGFYISETDDLALLHAEYADVVRSVAEEEDVVFCDLHAHFDRMHPKQAASHFIDGIHPNPKGDARIARMLYECLETAGELNSLLK